MSVTIQVTEFAGLLNMGAGLFAPIPMGPPLASYIVVGTTSTRSPAFQAGTTVIRVKGDPSAACYVLTGSSAPTAVKASSSNGASVSTKLSIDETEWFGVQGNAGWKIAVYDGSS
jgi:hypothetical protein